MAYSHVLMSMLGGKMEVGGGGWVKGDIIYF